MPLYDPLTFYQQLMHEDKSRVKSCRVGYLSDYRWHPVMAVRRRRSSSTAQWSTAGGAYRQCASSHTAAEVQRPRRMRPCCTVQHSRLAVVPHPVPHASAPACSSRACGGRSGARAASGLA